MTVKQENGKTTIELSGDFDLEGIKDQLEFLAYWEIVSKSKATQEDADNLAEESKLGWWEKNGAKYLSQIK